MPRRYLDQEGRHLRQTFSLRKWFRSDPAIRVRYFSEIDHINENLRTDEGEAPDRSVVLMLAGMCEHDGSFDSHVLEQNVNPIDWKAVREVGAAVAWEAHNRETEEGTWP